MVPDRLQPLLDECRPLSERFVAAGKRLYLVGGVVRDQLLGIERGGLAYWIAAVREFLAGSRRDLSDVPLDLRGTDFQRAVWSALRRVPYGATISYGELAARAGRPGAARACGAANGSNPAPLFVPCHRTIGSSGALVGFGGGLPLKRRLLELERGA